MVAVYPATTEKITVNSIIDAVDSSDNSWTLREAIITAKTNQRSGLGSGECEASATSGLDTIIVPPGTYTLTIVAQDEDDGLQGEILSQDNRDIDTSSN